MHIIEFKDFTFKYDNLKQPTLKNINLRICPGEKVLIVGQSGSGKSTLAHCINGLIPFTYKGSYTGTLNVDGIIPKDRNLHEVSNHVGTILQDQDGQFVGLTVGEDVAFASENNCISLDVMIKGINDALHTTGMQDFINETPQNLSGGQKQKVSLSGILSVDTPILLFDEPLANLDPVSGQKAMEIIDDIHEATKKTIIIIEHRIEDVLEHNIDKVVVVSNGEIVAEGTPDEILEMNILMEHGLREPLYIEALRSEGVNIKKEDHVSQLNNAVAYKDQIISSYNQHDVPVNDVSKETQFKIENLTFRYPKHDSDVLTDVSFEIKKGELLALLGNNGAGKSTLVKALAGMVKPQVGRLMFEDQEITDWSIRQRASIIGYVMQNPNHMITQTKIYDEVAFGPKNFGYSSEEIAIRTENALKVCGLYPYRNWPVTSISYGQRKRVSIASILSLSPKLLILDEPTAGQDYQTFKEFMTFIEDIKNQGISILLITHDMQLAQEYAERGIVLSKGKIIADDSLVNILSNKEVVRQADLRETSLSRLAELYNIENKSDFLAYFLHQCKRGNQFE